MPQPVLDAMVDHLRLEAAIGGYEAEHRAQDRIDAVYPALARLLGCAPDEIAVVENATRAWDMAFYGIPFAPGDRILTVQSEYASNFIAYLQVARQRGIVVDVVPSDPTGQVDVAALRGMIDERVRLISMTHMPTNNGLVNPAAAVGQVAREAGVLYLLDACQSVGQMPIDVGAIGCDLLSAAGRKFLRGPRASGFLYVRRGVLDRLEPPLLDMQAAEWTAPDAYVLRPDARRFETWETSLAAKLGLAAAVDYALGWGLDVIWARVQALAAGLRARLGAIPGVQVRDIGAVQGGIVTFTVAGWDPVAVRARLWEHGINVWISTASGTLLDMRARGLDAVVRASVHYYNTDEELDRCAAVVAELAAERP